MIENVVRKARERLAGYQIAQKRLVRAGMAMILAAFPYAQDVKAETQPEKHLLEAYTYCALPDGYVNNLHPDGYIINRIKEEFPRIVLTDLATQNEIKLTDGTPEKNFTWMLHHGVFPDVEGEKIMRLVPGRDYRLDAFSSSDNQRSSILGRELPLITSTTFTAACGKTFTNP